MAYTTIDDPSQYFQTKIYTGTGSSNAITNDGNSDLQPDWIWGKARTQTYNHNVFDTSRGLDKRLTADQADAENTDSTTITAVGSDGFTLGTSANLNGSSVNYVAWQWKANGGTTSSDSNGSITSTVQANTTAGFSIVTYTGNGSQGATIGHGLGVVPNVVLVKGRNIGDSWTMLHTGIASDFQTDMIKLDENSAAQDNSVFWNDTAPTSSVFTVDGAGGETKVNANTYTYVAYCFAEKQGYSKFGSYTGNGNADGTFVYTGFKPAWIMTKRTDSTSDWNMYDNKRNTFNKVDKVLQAEGNDAEYTSGSGVILDFLSNGFKVRGTGSGINADGGSYIYMAFAEHPFVSSKGVPVTAR
jgi:hypothetical protein